MSQPPELAMRLDLGLKVDDLLDTESLLGKVLDLPLELKDDLELGGAYYEYQPSWPLPETGITGVRIYPNHVEGRGWFVPYRKDLPYLAQIDMAGTNLLELGRFASVLESAEKETVSLTGYVVGPRRPGAGGRSLWRAHFVEFPSDEAAAPHWDTGLRHEAPRDGEQSARQDAPILCCQLTFGLQAPELERAANRVRSILGLELETRQDAEMGGRYLEYSRPSAPVGALSSLLVRPNALNPWTWLYPDRKDQLLLIDLTLSTPNLLELGRMAATFEAHWGDELQVMAYRAVGDLVRDRIPRCLERELTSKEDAEAKWHLGHAWRQDSEEAGDEESEPD